MQREEKGSREDAKNVQRGEIHAKNAEGRVFWFTQRCEDAEGV